MSKRFFLQQFLKSPRDIGAIAPSSQRLCSLIVKEAKVKESKVVLEYGPGTGACTREILKARRGTTEVFAVEINKVMARRLIDEFPEITVFQDSAENIRTLLAKHGHEKVQSIVGCIPWAAFSHSVRHRLMKATIEVMDPDGVFTTFALLPGLALPAGIRFGKELHQYFDEVKRTPIVWSNMPPAFVYVCRKPKKLN